jgi:amino acid permease
LGTAFLAHFNAPTFFHDLQRKSVPRFRAVVNAAFGISTSVFAAMMVFGFGTFGSATAGNVFVNYNKVVKTEKHSDAASCPPGPR